MTKDVPFLWILSRLDLFPKLCIVFDKEHPVKFPQIVNVKRMLVNVSVLVCPGPTFFFFFWVPGHVISMHVGSTWVGSSHSMCVFCSDLHLVWGRFWPTFVISSPSFIIPRTFEMAWMWVFKYWFPTGVDLTTYRVTWSYDTMSGQAAFVIQGQGCFFALRRNDCVGRHLFLHVLGNWVFLSGMTFVGIACNER